LSKFAATITTDLTSGVSSELEQPDQPLAVLNQRGNSRLTVAACHNSDAK
jgi:hypothetical protein